MTEKNLDHNKTNEELQQDFLMKISNLFSNDEAFVEYLFTTKRSFLYRYLETTTDHNINIKALSHNEFVAESFESNMGDAFKSTDKDIKEGVKNLAKQIKREDHPKVQYTLSTKILSFHNAQGKIEIEAAVNWGFPNFDKNTENKKTKSVIFNFSDVAHFRKELALKYEEACELFL